MNDILKKSDSPVTTLVWVLVDAGFLVWLIRENLVFIKDPLGMVPVIFCTFLGLQLFVSASLSKKDSVKIKIIRLQEFTVKKIVPWLRYSLLVITIILPLLFGIELGDYRRYFFDLDTSPSPERTLIALYTTTIGLLTFFYALGLLVRFYQIFKTLIKRGG
jgi:hypothetical protein